MSGHCESSPRFVDSSNHLEGVGYCEEHADPVEGGGEVEEAGEPANAEDADQGHAALQLGHDLGLLVQVVVPVDSLNHIVVITLVLLLLPHLYIAFLAVIMAMTKMTPLTATTAATGPMKAQMKPVSGSSQQWCGVPYLYSTVQYSIVQYSTVPAEVQRLVAEDGEGDH